MHQVSNLILNFQNDKVAWRCPLLGNALAIPSLLLSSRLNARMDQIAGREPLRR